MAHDEQDQVDGWQTYSNWIDNLRDGSSTILRLDNDSNFRERMLSSKSNLDRFELLWNNEEIRSYIRKVYETDSAFIARERQARVGKSIHESTRMRLAGNKSFKEGKFMDALKLYTQAVRFAPYPTQDNWNDTLALALANRSAALYSLTRYRMCLLDIDLAMKYGYPEASMFKLLIRKVKCLHILSVWANDLEQIKDDLKKMLKKSDIKEFVRAEICAMFEFLEQTHPEEMEKDELDVVDEVTMKISNASKTLPQAADCVEMSFDSEKGRYLMTNKDISFGRLLVAEEPYVCNLAPHKRDEYCYNCFGRLYKCGLGCTNCTQVLFCSEECLEAKTSTHSLECNKLLDFQNKLGVAYLVLHILFKINFNLDSIPVYTRKNVDKKPLDDVLKITLNDWPDQVFKNDYASVLSLMDHSADFCYDELMGLAITAVYIVNAIQNHFSVPQPSLLDNKTQLVIGSVILRHLMQLQTNLISILDQDLRELSTVGQSLSEIREKPIGVGIYPTISLLNHSCSPNVLSIFHRNKFIVRAASSLECGSEINYCYGPSVSRMSKKDRQDRLLAQYFFTCKCDSCTNNKENERRALLCPKCQGPIIYNRDFTHKCLKCLEEGMIDVEHKYLKPIEKLELRLNQLRHNDTDSAEKLQELELIESALSKLVFWTNPLFVQIKSQMIECAEEMADLTLVLRFCEEELDLCDRTYGKDSYESLMTQLKLINNKWQNLYYSVEEGKTRELRTNAIKGLKSLLIAIGETRVKLKDLLASTNIIGAESSFDTELKFLEDIQNSVNTYLSDQEPLSEHADSLQK